MPRARLAAATRDLSSIWRTRMDGRFGFLESLFAAWAAGADAETYERLARQLVEVSRRREPSCVVDLYRWIVEHSPSERANE